MLKKEKINIVQLYSILFVGMFIAVFIQFILSGRTFVWAGDGQVQHLPAYIYFGRYLRTIFRKIFVEHSFYIPQWDFAIGEGSDIFQSLNYYVIGDPFAIFSFLFPSHLMYIYYSGMCVARIYCAGLAFLYLCKVMGYSEKIPVLAGTLMYAFCYWAFYNCARHPYFINPLIWFPLIIAEIERIIQGKKPFLYVLFVMIAAISSFYFFYMIAILVALYVVLKLFYLYKTDLKKIIKTIFLFFVYSCVALGLAAFLFMPICYIFLHDARASHFQLFSFFYPLSYYSRLPLLLLFPHSPQWLCLGFPVLSSVSLVLLFKEPKKNCFMLILLSCCIIIIMMPVCGLVLNGFSYVANRWSWAFALLCSYAVVATWEQLLKAFKILLFLILIFAVYSFSLNLKHQIAVILYISFLVVFAFTIKTKIEIRSIIAFSLICMNVVLNANIRFLTYSKECLSPGELSPVLLNETALIRQAASGNKNFFRYSGKELTPNASINKNLSAIRYDWTLTNPYIMEFRRAMELPFFWTPFNYGDYDSRAMLESLACVQYFYKQDKNKEVIPYGFSPSEIKSVYKNDFSLPLAYTYDAFMNRNDWNALDSVQRGESLLQVAVLEEHCDSIRQKKPSLFSKKLSFALAKSDFSFSIRPEDHRTGELYVCLKNFRTINPQNNRMVIQVKSSGGCDIPFVYTEPGHQWYYGLHDISINLGYSEKSIEKIEILLPEERTFAVDDIQVISLPMTQFASLIDERKKDAFNNVRFGTNTVEGDISLTEPKLLCFAIPFATGWEATVDGQPAKLLRTNVMHMSVPLEAGKHKVVLTYHTPLLKVGFIVSLFSWVIFLFWVYRSKRK